MQKYLDFKKELNYKDLQEIAKIIKDGGIVIFPTETVYGIGVNALNKDAVQKLYEIKQRPLNKPISLLVSNIDMINQVAKNITELEYKLIKKFFPGPLTLVLNKKDIIPDIVTSNKNTVGIRMPANEIALKLIEMAGIPIATTSANISGEESAVEIQSVLKDFEGKVECFIDGGNSEIGIAYTIVQVINGVPKILRQGYISEEKIKSICEKR